MSIDELFDLRGRVAIVTGAGRGLGKAIVIGLAKAGAKVVIADVNEELVAETVKEVSNSGREAIGLKVDVKKRTQIRRMVEETIEKFGRIDILVNNAGIFGNAPAESMKEEEWDNVIETNLKGQFLCAQEVGNQMIKQKSGKIINIASTAGTIAIVGQVAYNVSKAGVILLTKTLAVEWGKHNINVNAINPGVFRTPGNTWARQNGFLEKIQKKTALGRHGEPEEIVGTVIYLASKASDYVTGHALVVDGGRTAALY